MRIKHYIYIFWTIIFLILSDVVRWPCGPENIINIKDKSFRIFTLCTKTFNFVGFSAEIFVFQCSRQTDWLHKVCGEALQGSGGWRSVLPWRHPGVGEIGPELGVPGDQWRHWVVSPEHPPSPGHLPQPQLPVRRPHRDWLHPPHSDQPLHLRLWQLCILGSRPRRRQDHRGGWIQWAVTSSPRRHKEVSTQSLENQKRKNIKVIRFTQFASHFLCSETLQYWIFGLEANQTKV